MTERIDPGYDPLVRARVHRAVNHVLWTAKDVLWRYTDKDGDYVEPSGVADGGNANGVINAAMNQVIIRLQTALNESRAELFAVSEEIHDYKRELHGDSYNPVPNPLFD